jgi:hypothetical protein
MEEENLPTDEEIKEMQEQDVFLVSDEGKYLHKIDIGTFLAPMYADCNGCYFAPKNGGNCVEYKEGADCSIERTYFQVLMRSLAEVGIDDLDRLVIFPFVQQMFRMRRLYALEKDIDYSKLFVFDEKGKSTELELYDKILKMISDNEKGYMQKMKELAATRKERMMKRSKINDKNTFSLKDLFDAKEVNDD